MRRFLVTAILAIAAFSAASAQNEGLKVRFLGTGAADWKGVPDERGEYRRLTSALVDDSILIDFTPTDEDMIPEGCRPKAVFYTHSHGDHYNVMSGLRVGVEKVYCSATWAQRCRAQYEKAAAELGVKAPEVIGLATQEEVTVNGVTFKALPANHFTGDLQEQALIYLMIKGAARVLYATDTAGIPANAAVGGRFGTDGLKKEMRIPLTGVIMESTVGIGGEENYRLFSHSCVELVLHTVHVLLKTGCYKPAEGQPVYLTHLARTLHGTQAELDAGLPAPLKAAYDGLEVVF